MQNQTEKPSSNIVSLFAARNGAKQSTDTASEDVETQKESFLSAIKKNSENEERLRKERLKANQSVLKSYRIKN